MGLDAYAFLKGVLRTCRNKPLILVDRGPWYPWALELYGLRHRVKAWFSIVKARTRRFYNNFPHGSSMDSVERWVASFTAIHNTRLGLS